MSVLILHKEIEKVCPIDGVSGDRNSIRVDFKDNATQQQKDAALVVVNSFNWDNAAKNALIDKVKSLVDTPNSAESILINVIAFEIADELRAIKAGNPKAGRSDQKLKDDIKEKLDLLKS